MVEFFEDLIDKDPNEEFPPQAFASGKVVLRTGDAVVDKWEQEIADGKTPDLLESFFGEELEKMKKILKRSSTASQLSSGDVEVETEFTDDYTKSKG